MRSDLQAGGSGDADTGPLLQRITALLAAVPTPVAAATVIVPEPTLADPVPPLRRRPCLSPPWLARRGGATLW